MTWRRTDRARGPLTDVDALARAWPGCRRCCSTSAGGSAARRARPAYRAGHLPGAVFVDLDRDLAAAPGPGGPSSAARRGPFQAAMRRAGVSNGRHVVVYDEADSTAAARAWWLLRYFGHGGSGCSTAATGPGWRPAGRWGVTGGGRRSAPGDFTARPGRLPLLDADGGRAPGPGRASCWTPGRPSATGARPSRSTRSPGTSPAR